jgi:hypothetical protein
MVDTLVNTSDVGNLPFVEPGAVIHQVHKELLEAERRREEEGLFPLFEVESLEIEMRVVLSQVQQRGGKVDLKLIAITGDTKIDASHTHTIRIKLRTVEDHDANGPGGRSAGLRPSVRKKSSKARSDA